MDVKDISVIYQDHYMLVLNKPAGVVIHPTYKHRGDTLWEALLLYLEQQGGDAWEPPAMPDEPQWAGAPHDVQVMLRARRIEHLWESDGLLPRPCLLHRLDKDTSGVVAVARTAHSCNHLARQFQVHTADKHYLALVRKGAPDWARPRVPLLVTRGEQGKRVTPAFDLYTLGDEQLLLEGPLQRDPEDRRRCIVGAEGLPSATALRLLALHGDYALLDVRPITGRTHQIRAHLAAYGYAIVGDQTYAPPLSTETLTRQFLHARQLTLRTHPGNQPVTFVAPLASDLLHWMEQFFPAGLTHVGAEA